MSRVQIVHDNFLRRVATLDFPAGKPARGPLDTNLAIEIFRAQIHTRQLDRTSRDMQVRGTGFYTIGSSGHEGVAAVARALRPSDMAFLHYRDGAFQMARADQVPGQNMVWDMLLSFSCATQDPISGGRHKVLGSKALNIPPQTSTIASHLPKAVGAAYSIGLARRRQPDLAVLPSDGLAYCSFGDASLNHSTAQGAINAACWTAVQSSPLPVLFTCEDNGIGISTETPKGWVAASVQHRPGLKYFYADGLDIFDTYKVSSQAAEYVRAHQKPAFLHLRTVRLYGHAGADVATSYLPTAQVEKDEANDPLLHSARQLIEAGALTGQDVIDMYNLAGDRIEALAKEAEKMPRLANADEVMAQVIPGPRPVQPVSPVCDLPGRDAAQPMSRLINWALADILETCPETIVMGEDVGRKGGVYGATQKLQAQFGPDRVIDTLLDEQSVLGLAIGLGHNGFIPIPEIQFLAYLHNAEDQIRGEAATLPFFSQGQFTNPMVLRIAGLGYQKGFGGHFHNDNSLAVLRDIPGIVIACPSRGADAAKMLRESVRLAREENRIVLFIEPIALYPMRDLWTDGDQAWMDVYPTKGEIPLGSIGVQGLGRDLAIVTYGNGHYLSQKVAPKLDALGIAQRIIDLRWLAPLPEQALLEATKNCRNVLIVDECRRTGGQAEALMTLFQEAGRQDVARVVAEDSFISTGPAYGATLPSAEGIIDTAKSLVLGDDVP